MRSSKDTRNANAGRCHAGRAGRRPQHLGNGSVAFLCFETLYLQFFLILIAAKTPSKLRDTKLGVTVNEIIDHANVQGLKKDELARVIAAVSVRNELDQASITALIKNLFPSEKVPSDIVYSVVGALGNGKRNPSPTTQTALVKWLIATHDVFEDEACLGRLYGVLFNLLDMFTLRTPLCHLLSLIARRKHVRPFRIHRLLELCRWVGNEPALIGLLRVYQNYYPEIIVGSTVSGRASALSQPDPEWRRRLIAIQDATSWGQLGSGPRGGFRVARDLTKRSKNSVIPEVHTFHANETSVTLEEIDSAEHFVENLERIDPPSQIVAGLTDPLLQKYLMLGLSSDVPDRLRFWLLQYFDEELQSIKEGFGLSTSLPSLLSGLISYTEATKILCPLVQAFLIQYIPHWDGSSNLGSILDLLSYVPPQDFSQIYLKLLSPLERAILSGAHSPFQTLFDFYAALVTRWYGAITPTSPTQTASCLTALLNHISTLALSALLQVPSSASAVLTFYDRTTAILAAALPANPHLFPIIIPPPPTAYLLLLSSSLAALSRTSAILARCKAGFEAQLRDSRVRSPVDTGTFNGYLMDACNLLWRSRALVTTDANAMGCLVHPAVVAALQAYLVRLDTEYSVPTTWSFGSNPVLAGLCARAFRDIERGKLTGPVTRRALVGLEREGIKVGWREYRVMMLDWLAEHGAGGIRDLMYATMKDLMK
ncbi:Mis6-domain-containing protein [Trichodelitschia bisporula]|uniref:Mis6-domain-containing protein n=1 Tax=Trichodelitschia bisporula TaxID=703511 RepID=A0A6G1HMJ7_9PEZI|nr:Mis6-domain-containing protein [Trichodelitschia bisporula]